MKITQASLQKLSLPDDKTDAIYFDDEVPGLGVRIRAGGSRKFVVDYRLGGIRRRHTIGSAQVLTLEEARRKARKVLVAVDDGRDPTAEQAQKRAAAGLVFAAVVDDYLDAVQAHLRPRSVRALTAHLKKHFKPLHKLPLGAVNRAMVASHLRAIAKGSGIIAANRARSAISSLYAWAIGEGLCETNPVIGTNMPGEEKPRDRVLSDTELVRIWNALPDNDYGKIVKLLMLTGQRREEFGSLKWSEIVGDAIHLGGNRTKNGLPHTIPLSDEALAILQSVVRRAGRDCVLGEGANGFTGWSQAKAKLDTATGINKPWRLHDLRRTTATGMAGLGVLPHVIEAVLNHISGHKAGVAGIYNKNTYEPEKRAALELWASHVRKLVAPTKRGA